LARFNAQICFKFIVTLKPLAPPLAKSKTQAQPKYDAEELEVLRALEAGQLKSVADSK
jgi:hypothetical protein